jgi:hypothetical protein
MELIIVTFLVEMNKRNIRDLLRKCTSLKLPKINTRTLIMISSQYIDIRSTNNGT